MLRSVERGPHERKGLRKKKGFYGLRVFTSQKMFRVIRRKHCVKNPSRLWQLLFVLRPQGKTDRSCCQRKMFSNHQSSDLWSSGAPISSVGRGNSQCLPKKITSNWCVLFSRRKVGHALMVYGMAKFQVQNFTFHGLKFPVKFHFWWLKGEML